VSVVNLRGGEYFKENRMNFVLDMEQSIAAAKFDKEHWHLDKEHGAISGGLTYSFTNTSLGQVAKVHCSICDTELDLTDYYSW